MMIKNWIALVGCAVIVNGCAFDPASQTEQAGSLESELLAGIQVPPSVIAGLASFDPAELARSIAERKNTHYSLNVETCDASEAQSADAVYVGILADGYAPEVAVGKLGAQRGKALSVDLTGYVPVDPNDLKSLTIRKRGRDPWCLSRVELRRENVLIWRYDESDSGRREQDAVGTTYLGPHQAGKIWLDDDKARAPARSVVFSDWRVPLPPKPPNNGPNPLPLPAIFFMRPLELEIHTCKNGVHPQTNDPVELSLEHDGMREIKVLDNVGNDREANSLDRYMLNEHGLASLGNLQLRKSGTDGWCIDSIVLYLHGEEVLRRDGQVILDNDPSVPGRMPALNIPVNRSVNTTTAERWFYPGLPLRDSPFWSYEHGEKGQDCRTCEPTSSAIDYALNCRPCNSGLTCDDGTCVATGGWGELCTPAGVNPITFSSSPESCDSNLECVETLMGRRCVINAGQEGQFCHDSADGKGKCNKSEPALSCDPVDRLCKQEKDLVFVPIKGERSCDYGDPACNRCVWNVRSAFSTFAKVGGDNHSYLVDNDTDDFFRLKGKNGRHFQSFVRVPNRDLDTPWFVASHGGSAGSPLFGVPPEGHFLVVNGQKGSAVKHVTTDLSGHPGGMQAVGGYVLVPHDTHDGDGPAYIEVLSAHDPRELKRVAYANIGTKIPTKENYRAASVGGVKLADGTYLLITNYSSSNAYYDFFRARDLNKLSGFEVLRTHVWAQVKSENLSLLTECGTGDVYAVSTTGRVFGPQGVGYNDWRLLQVGKRGGEMSLDVLSSVTGNRDTECDTRYAGTAAAGPKGELALYCHQRSEHDGFGRERVYYRSYWIDNAVPK